MTTSAHLAGSVHELLDLALGEIAALDCEVFDSWSVAIGYLIGHGKSLSCKDDWKDNSPLFASRAEKKRKEIAPILFLKIRLWDLQRGVPRWPAPGGPVNFVSSAGDYFSFWELGPLCISKLSCRSRPILAASL